MTKPWVSWRVLNSNAIHHMTELYQNLEVQIKASAAKYLAGEQIKTEYRCSGTKLPEARQGHVVSKGLLSEVITTETDEYGRKTEKLSFRADWKTGGINFINGSLVQNYIQWTDPVDSDKHFAMICNAEFNRYQQEANFTYIGNYHSEDSLTVNDLKGHSYGDNFKDNKLDWTYEDQTAEHKFTFFSPDPLDIAK